MEKYIHYGSKKFEKDHFTDISNHPYMTKPFGGLWASRVNAIYGWKDWCDSSEFRKCKEENSFSFVLSENARVLYINSVEDLEGLPEVRSNSGFPSSFKTLNFEELKKNYDAIEVNISWDRELYFLLYGWDCDSILIMNPDIIEEIKS